LEKIKTIHQEASNGAKIRGTSRKVLKSTKKVEIVPKLCGASTKIGGQNLDFYYYFYFFIKVRTVFNRFMVG